MNFTWKEIVCAGVALSLGTIAVMHLPMFKTERQKRDELLTPEQRKKIAVMETICRGETPVGLDKQIYPNDRNAACFIARRSREIIVDQAKVKQNPHWEQELALEVKKATDRHRECEQHVRKVQIEKEAARTKGYDYYLSAADSRYEFCDREYNMTIFSVNLKYGGNLPERSVRQ